jgi:hypothetical protein
MLGDRIGLDERWRDIRNAGQSKADNEKTT